jgi:hypothetical protein
MKKWLIPLVLAMVLGLGGTKVSLADVMIKHASGTVAAIDAKKDMDAKKSILEVQGQSGKTSFVITRDTKILGDSKNLTLGELPIGQKVTVSYVDFHGQHQASEVWVEMAAVAPIPSPPTTTPVE